jgi:NAD(P)-dependent dehydrogenase (short-subunit alcohol dehydrogenase family)
MAGLQDLDGRLALVTGAGSGIGKATALALAGEGCRVIAADVDGEAAEKTSAACAERGPGGWAEPVDVADALAVTALAERVTKEQGPVDVLVANAGVGMTGRFLDMSLDDWRWIRGVNLDGVVHTVQAFGAPMIERGSGHVAIVSSGLAYTMRATEPGYVTTKAAVLALARCLDADWRPRGIGVTAVCPGVINTPIIEHTRFLGAQDDPKRRSRTEKMFRRGHKPEKVAAAVVDAVRRGRTVAPVGWEAKLGWWAHRLTPVSVQQFIARQGPNA